MKIVTTGLMGFGPDKIVPCGKWGNRPITATVGDQTCRFRSEFEYRWAKWLQRLYYAGGMLSWQYEPRRFEFPDELTGAKVYTPDFLVVEPSGERTWHECKGRLVGSDVTKFRRMAKYYPAERLVLVMLRMPTRGEAARRLAHCRKYVTGVIDGGAILRKVGL